jgi:integrase
LERLCGHTGRPLEQINADGLADFLHHLVTSEKLKASTLNQAFCGIRLYFRDYRKRRRDEWEIWDQFRIRRNKALPHVLTQEEVQRLLQHVRKGRYRSVLTTMYLCGLRISEAVSLKPQNIIGQRRVVQILNSKGGKSREIPLCDELYEKLRIHWKHHRNPSWLFPAKPRNWRSFGSVRNALGRSSSHIGHSMLQKVFQGDVPEVVKTVVAG